MLVNISQFAAAKKCSRQIITKHLKLGNLISTKIGHATFLDTENKTNKSWMPGLNNGRPRGSKNGK